MYSDSFVILAFWSPGPFEWLVIGIVAILLFGRRLPELGRSLGRSLMEFKKGIREVQDELDSAKEDTQSEAKQPTSEEEYANAKPCADTQDDESPTQPEK